MSNGMQDTEIFLTAQREKKVDGPKQREKKMKTSVSSETEILKCRDKRCILIAHTRTIQNPDISSFVRPY